MDSNYTMFENSISSNDQKKKVHIPFLDVDDLAYKSRQHDPSFIASISKIKIEFNFLFYQIIYVFL
jgi:hypothetical protein